MPYRRSGKKWVPAKETPEVEVVATPVLRKSLSCEPSAYATIPLAHQHRRFLGTQGEGTDSDEDRLALADAFTGRAQVEVGPRGSLNMIEERLGRHILVATRAYSVGTSGHSTAAGVGEVGTDPKLVNVYEETTTKPQGNQAPRGRSWVSVTEPTFRARRGESLKGAFFERKSSSPRHPSPESGPLGAYRACLAKGASRMLRAGHTPAQNPRPELPPWRWR